ncbi:Hpt domain-containing protein [Thauera sp. AutoDN2]|uniref:hybrid sensor histidine kinase/response regulator n=1 Tax=Thauera sp. AutoDN2 TaxID=3416051 RepID=UPI003F4BB81B
MTNATEPDLGALTWVKGEIDAALARAREALEQGADADGTAGLQFAQTHLHQVRGALAIVGLDGLTQFADATEKLLSSMAHGEAGAPAAQRELVRRALAMIGNYLDELAHGAPDQPLRLGDTYLELVAASGQTAAGPVDLFHPDLSRRPPALVASSTASATPSASDDAGSALRNARSRFERGLLDWLRKGNAGEGARTMREAIAEVARLQQGAPAHALWWISLAFYDALIADDLQPEPAVKRLCTQIDAQFRRLLTGTASQPDRLLRELLYEIAHCPAVTPHQRAVRSFYGLEALLPTAGVQVSGTPTAPLLDALGRHLAAARLHWDAFCAGTAVDLQHFEHALVEMGPSAATFSRPGVERLIGALAGFAHWLRRDPLQLPQAAAMEVATALLTLETALTPRPAEPGFTARADALAERLAALQRGETLGEDEGGDSFRAASQAQEKAAIEQLVKEMRSSLAQVEQTLDDFFRDQAKRDPLEKLHHPLQQIIGALSVLGETEALAIVRDAATRIASLTREDASPEDGKLEALAERLSAFGFYLDALPRGGANIHALLAHGVPGAPHSAPTESAQPYEPEDEAGAPVQMPVAEAETPAAAIDEALNDELARAQQLLNEPQAALTLAPLAKPAAPPTVEAEPPAAAPATTEPAGEEQAPIDEELLGIFIEEAHEVLATQSEQLELLRTAPGDREALVTIRRSFHTLKGSGRMVGLTALGEVAWAVEQTLNRWLQLEWPVTPALLHFIDDGREVFSRWVALLETRDMSPVEASALITDAERLRNAEQAPVLPAQDQPPAEPEVLEPALPEIPPPEPEASKPEPAAEAEMVLESAAFLIDAELGELPPLGPEETAEAPHAPAPAPDNETPEAAAFSIEDFPAPDLSWDEEDHLLEPLEIDLLPEPIEAELPPEAATASAELPEFERAEPEAADALDEETATAPTLEAVDIPPTEAAEQPAVVRIGDVEISAALHELYCSEAVQHLDTLASELLALQAGAHRPPSAASIRAVHTFTGISGTTRLDAPHKLGRALERALERLAEGGRVPDAEELALFEDAQAAMRAMLAETCAGQAPQATPTLVSALDSAARMLEPPAPTEAEPAMKAEPAAQSALAVEDEGEIESALDVELKPAAGVEPPSEVATEPLRSEPAPSEIPTSPVRTESAAREAAEQLPPVRDDLDADLLPIFLEEAGEVLGQLHDTLRNWRNAPHADSEAPKVLARLLHSLKGSARMAGAMSLGTQLHQLESRLEDGLAARESIASLVDALAHGLDQSEQTIGALTLGDQAAEVPGEAAGAEGAARAPTAADEGTPQGEAAPDAEVLSSPTLRVRTELIDRFVNQSGEIGVARSRIDGELRTLRRSLLDLTENVIRLRNQLREVEIQADVQMQSRIAQSGAEHGDFDPLELDRYTRLQELTRMMAESVNDVTTVQQNLLLNLDGAELALNSQARLARDLQQGLMQVRMLPFESLASRLYRVVRQSARDLGKRANLDLRGGRISVDRSVLEQIAAPLEHLLRNALAHGIETPSARHAAGKPETGDIIVNVRQEGNEIAIDVSDDGAGLDLERIAARGRERGLLGEHEQADERRLTNLIFLSGFSTASELSAVSGRGVGMDVVKAQAAAIGGRVSVASTRGAGTRFTIHIPLTLAVTRALLVQSGGRTWAIPSSLVAQAMELKPAPLRTLQEQHGYAWQGEHFPYRYLPRLLGDRDARPLEQRYNWVLLLRAGAQRLALHVDGLRGNQDIVVKNAGPQLTRVVGMSGATVLGDGEVVIILNPVALASRGLGEQEIDSIHLPPESEAPPPLHLPTVMVVDDSLTVRKITGRLLEREGYRVITAKDGVDALEQLIDTLPDVVLSDIEMPRMDGFDLVRNIRADKRLQHLPVIMITSRLAEKHRRYAEEIGANHYLGKPYQEEELLALVAGYITGQTQAPA